MRNTLFLTIGFLILTFQSNLHNIFQYFPFQIPVPDLLLPLIIFLGIHETPVAEGTAISFVLGYFYDLFSASPTGLFTFITVATYVVTRLAGIRIGARTWITKVGFVFVFSLLQSALIIIFTVIFGNDSSRSRFLVPRILPLAIATTTFSFFIFPLLEKVHRATLPKTKSRKNNSL